MASCFDCGAQVADEDRFCGNCGIALQRGDAPAQGEVAPAGEPPSSSQQLSSSRAGEPGESAEEKQADAHDDSAHADEYSAELQPTLIESSHGGQATAAARAHEPVAPAESPSSDLASSNLPTPSSDLAASSDLASSSSSDLGSSSTGIASSSSDVADSSEAAVNPSDSPTVLEERGEAAGDQSKPLPWESAAIGQDEARANTSDEPEARRHTGDIAERASNYTGRTGGSRRASRATSQLEPGTFLYGRYEIVKRIGGGGMGAVYYAKDKNLGDAPRAVKEMVQTHLDESQQEKAVADFRRESMLLASLEHPSIPTIYDYFYDDTASRFYLVMKYISGGDCLARLRNAPGGRIEELKVAEWGAQVADVLEYLHNQRPPIIYRDLKPANLMIDGNNGRVMLIDFGIARWVAPQEKGVTAVGTMGYAPPELFSGKAEPRTDIYSLGATMFHLTTGADPQDNPLLIFDFTKNPTPRQINPAISNEMEWILMRAVEYEPEKRFRSAAEMRDTLAQHVERLRAGAVTYGAVRGPQSQSVSTIAVERVFCGFCGKSISSEDVFCPHCGARQPIAAASASLRAARATARLVVAGTTELEATFTLEKEMNLVGRTDPQSNIFPDIDLSRFDPETKISRRHARIWREGDTFLLEDLGSVNGTVVNDAVRLGPRQPRPLANGDRLRLGETTLHFLIG
ncbi:MAG TPA: protein kinase [Pyrinomonadaceae bacterium]|nr:protein kinase [Pyrinomonadaceae bacterium]